VLWESGWRPQPARDDPVAPCVAEALTLLPKLISEIPSRLAPWEKRELPLHLCMCDIWHNHVLFTDDKVTGIVDYGSIKWDHAAVDLARLLGSLVGDDPGAQTRGIAAYRAVRALSTEEAELVAVLDRTGTLLGVANWLRWLYYEGRHYENREAVVERVATLIRRLQR
jgi:Ser/Thr protein kinase RdoA (MazF antagonist)